ncbi:cupin domain-containing protein [Haloplanus rubicundus]|uniref:Cupin domain-containing protein n=1 Tax=Haloplanus rubicundus TaxID=1547898 RepID=A0A345DZM4_9EURY|nr:cupin domain-containing protein [Haloplanus rubicundus]AXG05396.1 cupin domain-containing protein [Haloplanus rubicundus]AXG08751.1 cupin domain-containing protein [Haloplanus rubicundus]
MTDEFGVVRLEAMDEEPLPESGICHRKLTEALGCIEMRVNAVTLDPGEATAPHAHERQEEVYVALDGGHVRIEGTLHEVPAGGVVRVGPDAVRSVRNDGDEARTWLMFGAPPHGTVDDFGEYRMPEE